MAHNSGQNAYKHSAPLTETYGSVVFANVTLNQSFSHLKMSYIIIFKLFFLSVIILKSKFHCSLMLLIIKGAKLRMKPDLLLPSFLFSHINKLSPVYHIFYGVTWTPFVKTINILYYVVLIHLFALHILRGYKMFSFSKWSSDWKLHYRSLWVRQQANLVP